MSFVDALMAVSAAEWNFFGKDTGKGDKKVGGVDKEAVSPFSARIGDYWLSLPTSTYDRLVKAYAPATKVLDGTLRKLPWSAAFISYCFNQAGAGKKFPYSSGHATWINLAIRNRRDDKLGAALVGYRLGERPLKLGDVLGKARSGLGVDFDNALTFKMAPDSPAGWYESHSDIVVEIDLAKRKAFLIGGNVGQSVSKVEISIDSNGNPVPGTGGYFCHIAVSIEHDIAAAAKPSPLVLVG